MIDAPNTFGGWLRERREALALTQAGLGRLAGCAAATIRHIEAGRQRPSPRLARRLAEHCALAAPQVGAFLAAAAQDIPANAPAVAPDPLREDGGAAFAHWLKRCRGAFGMTQSEFAAQLHYAVGSYRKIEQGDRSPSRPFLDRLARLIHLPGADLPALLRCAYAGGEPPPLVLRELAARGDLALRPAPPRAPTALIGRERELAALGALLADADTRMVTIVGPPGVGKTRLSLEIAAICGPAFADGVCFVPLAPLTSVALLLPAIAGVLGGALPPSKGSAGGETLDRLAALLRGRRLLLILDNCEQIEGAGPAIAELLAGCPQLCVLATSRVILGIRAERRFTLAPLPLPDPALAHDRQSLLGAAAIALFVARAQAAKPDFQLTERNAPAVLDLCRRLDGLPLAIELIATRVAGVSPHAMLGRLSRRVLLETRGMCDLPERQQTLRATIEWSYGLLPAAERRLFARLGIFAGPWTIEALEAVCADGDDPLDAVASLLDMSLLERVSSEGRTVCFAMLETIREYAADVLEGQSEAPGELAELQRRHGAYYLGLAEAAETAIAGPDQQWWLERLEWEHANLRAALDRALAAGELDYALRMGAALWKFWQIHGHQREGWRRAGEILERTAERGHPARTRLLYGAGWIAEGLCDQEGARAMFAASRALAERLGDGHGAGLALHGLGALARNQARYREAQQLFASSLAVFQAVGDLEHIAWTLLHLGVVALEVGDGAEARTMLTQSLANFRAIDQRWAIALNLAYLGSVCRDARDGSAAEEYYVASRVVYEALGDRREMAVVDVRRAFLALVEGRRGPAIELYRASLAVFRQRDDQLGIATCIEGCAALAAADGDEGLAARLYRVAAAIFAAEALSPWPDMRASHALRVEHQRRWAGASAQRAPFDLAGAIEAAVAMINDQD